MSIIINFSHANRFEDSTLYSQLTRTNLYVLSTKLWLNDSIDRLFVSGCQLKCMKQ